MTDNSNMPAGLYCLIGIFGTITSLSLEDATHVLQFATAIIAFLSVLMSLYLYILKIRKLKKQ